MEDFSWVLWNEAWTWAINHPPGIDPEHPPSAGTGFLGAAVICFWWGGDQLRAVVRRSSEDAQRHLQSHRTRGPTAGFTLLLTHCCACPYVTGAEISLCAGVELERSQDGGEVKAALVAMVTGIFAKFFASIWFHFQPVSSHGGNIPRDVSGGTGRGSRRGGLEEARGRWETGTLCLPAPETKPDIESLNLPSFPLNSSGCARRWDSSGGFSVWYPALDHSSSQGRAKHRHLLQQDPGLFPELTRVERGSTARAWAPESACRAAACQSLPANQFWK